MRDRRFLAFLLPALLVGCGASKATEEGDPFTDDPPADGGGTDGGPDWEVGPAETGPNLESLAIDPPNATIFLDLSKPGTPATITYKAGIGGEDVTGKATFTVDDPSLGSFSGATFTSALTLPGTALGVTTTVRGEADGKAGEAKLTIVKIRKTEDASGKRDFFFTVPYNKDPDPPKDVLKFATNINKVDVAFVVDTTGSMSGTITNLKTALTSTIIPGLSKIPSVGLAVVDHRDSGDAWVVKILQKVTTDVAKAKSAVGLMNAGGGGDYAEGQISAMDYTLTGNANSGISPALPKVSPPAGTFGAVEFRPGAVPVLVLMTDAPWHDPSGAATTTTVTNAFKKNNAKFVNVNVGSKGGVAQANSLSDALGMSLSPSAFGGKCGAGKCCTGYKGAAISPDAPGGKCRLNFDGGGGDGVSDSIVTAIQAISVGSTYDVQAKISNDPTNADGVDAPASFVEALRAMDEGSVAEGCPAHEAYDSNSDGIKDTFKQVLVGTPVCFEIIAKKNTTVPAKESAQFFNAFIDMVGQPGDVDLGDRRSVVFLVPPKDPGIK